MAQLPSVTEFFAVIEPFRHLFLTKESALLGAIEIDGVDPDGIADIDHTALSAIAQTIYGKLNRNITISQYYVHFDGVKASIRDRAEPRSHTLSKRREEYLNTKKLSGSRLVHYLELEPDEDINRLNAAQFSKHLGLAVFDKQSRAIMRNQFSTNRAFLMQTEMLERMAEELDDALNQVVAKWGGIFGARRLTQTETWAHLRFLASMNPATFNLAETIPPDNLDVYVTAGDIQNVRIGNMDVMKLPSVINQYAKIASVRSFVNPGGKWKPGLWAADSRSPVRVSGNYLLASRWKPLTEFERSMTFLKKGLALERASINWMELLKGGEDRSAAEKNAAMKPRIKKLMDDLGAAESIPDALGVGAGYVVAFGEHPQQIRQTALDLDRAVNGAKGNLLWETVDLDRVFETLQPGNQRRTKCKLYMTSAQFGAASLLCQASTGQSSVPDLGDEEPQYIFTSNEGTLFGYSPFIGGRAFTLGVGPIRKGKTFLKDTKATHFLKYPGSLYRAVDPDPGSENIARVFSEDSGIFRVSNEDGKGMNPFASYRGPNDTAFRVHLSTLLLSMLKVNDAPEDREITPTEAQRLDDAIEQTLANPPHLRTLSHLVAHLDANMRRKFARWVRARAGNTTHNGRYAALFDVDKDSIGELTARIGVFNIQALRDDPARDTVLLEIFYRITQAFEDPLLRAIPKCLDMDEAHYALSIPHIAAQLISKTLNWGKWGASIQMWTQDPKHYADIPNWQAIRSAASTFWFFSDPAMNADLYQSTFNITRGHCEAIKNLIPKREAFLYQPEIGVAKVVVIDVEPEQRVLNTSHPREASIRDALIAEYGFTEGIRRVVEQMEHTPTSKPQLRIAS